MNYSTFKALFESAYPSDEAQVTKSLLAFRDMRQYILENYKDVFQTVQEFELYDSNTTKLLVFPDGTIRLTCGVGSNLVYHILYDEREHPVEIALGEGKILPVDKLKDVGEEFPLRKGTSIYNALNLWAFSWMFNNSIEDALSERQDSIENIKDTFNKLTALHNE